MRKQKPDRQSVELATAFTNTFKNNPNNRSQFLYLEDLDIYIEYDNDVIALFHVPSNTKHRLKEGTEIDELAWMISVIKKTSFNKHKYN